MIRPSRLAATLSVPLLAASGCLSPTPDNTELSPEARLALADTVRQAVRSFSALRSDPRRLCADPSLIRGRIAYPGGFKLNVYEGRVDVQTQAEFEATGISPSYWCSLRSIETRIDSIAVQILTRDVAITANHYVMEETDTLGVMTRYVGVGGQAWLRTSDGWKSVMGFDDDLGDEASSSGGQVCVVGGGQEG